MLQATTCSLYMRLTNRFLADAVRLYVYYISWCGTVTYVSKTWTLPHSSQHTAGAPEQKNWHAMILYFLHCDLLLVHNTLRNLVSALWTTWVAQRQHKN